MSPRYDPDPAGMGVPASLTCVRCKLQRYGECVSSDEDDVLILDPGRLLEIRGIPCSCGETRIQLDWITGTQPDDDY